MCGLPVWVYWSSAFIWDTCFFILICIAVMVIFFLQNVQVKNGNFASKLTCPFSKSYLQEYTSNVDTTMTCFFVMMMFGWAAIPFTYAFHFAFNSDQKGYTTIVIFNIISG